MKKSALTHFNDFGNIIIKFDVGHRIQLVILHYSNVIFSIVMVDDEKHRSCRSSSL